MHLPLPRTPLGLTSVARRWSTASQARARRNAMVALTSLAQRRAEREDVEAFLAAVAEPELLVPEQREALPGS